MLELTYFHFQDENG